MVDVVEAGAERARRARKAPGEGMQAAMGRVVWERWDGWWMGRWRCGRGMFGGSFFGRGAEERRARDVNAQPSTIHVFALFTLWWFFHAIFVQFYLNDAVISSAVQSQWRWLCARQAASSRPSIDGPALHVGSRQTPRKMRMLTFYSTERAPQHRRVSHPRSVSECRSYSATRSLLHDDGTTPAYDTQAGPDKFVNKELYSWDEQPGSPTMKTAVRNLMRHVPSSVSVITVHATQPGKEEMLPIGSAISSLTMVTLDPPHVSFNIKTPSRTLSAIHEAGGLFCVHFLENSMAAARLAHNYTEGNSDQTLRKRAQLLTFHSEETSNAKFAPPRILSDAVLASMTCQLTQEATVADHVVAIARVESFRSRNELDSTLIYHDGRYKSLGSAVIFNPQQLKKPEDKPSRRSALDIYYSYDLFPGEIEKTDFISHLKDHLKSNPAFLEQIVQHEDRDQQFLYESWGMESNVFGLNTSQIIVQCQTELGLATQLPTSVQSTPVTYRYYGSISKTDRASIQARAKKLVRSDPMVLQTYHQPFFAHLDVNPYHSNNLLASDILGALRQDGLAEPFEVRSMDTLSTDGTVNTITLEGLEQVEHRIMELFKSIPYQQAVAMDSEQLHKTIGAAEPGLSWYIRQKCIRFLTEAFPESFGPPHVDIAGHVSQEEARVIVTRFLSYINVDQPKTYATRLYDLWYVVCLKIGVHPMVSGIDMHFLHGKLRYINDTAGDWDQVRKRVEEMRESYFEKRIFTTEEVDLRMHNMFSSHFSHVVQWSDEDIVAAVGIHPDSWVTLQGSDLPARPAAGYFTMSINWAFKRKLEDASITPEEREAVELRLQPAWRPVRDFLDDGRKGPGSNLYSS